MARHKHRAIFFTSGSHHATNHNQLLRSPQHGAGHAMTTRLARSAPMKRTTPLQQKTPLKRTGFLRRAKEQVTKKVYAFKSRGPKLTPIRRAARGQDCQMQILGVCNGDPATTVLCHSNQLVDGKGMGLKAPDTEAVFGCSSCHDVLDGRAKRPDGMSMADLLELFAYARERTHTILRAKGLLA